MQRRDQTKDEDFKKMNPLASLIDAFRGLPGIGPKSAQRIALHLLQYRREHGMHLACCLENAMQTIKYCDQCNNHTTESLCDFCSNLKRDAHTLCIVESTMDLAAIEQTQIFNGRYFVLLGKISPLNGITAEDIGLDKLITVLEQGTIKEVIFALSPSIEGQTTAFYIQEMIKPYAIKITQLAHGIPSNADLEFLDAHTIRLALSQRATLS